jgi:hypothetical protein
METRSIFYKNRQDIEAYQTYRIITHRKMGKAQTLQRPELEHCGSAEFCWESYHEKINR